MFIIKKKKENAQKKGKSLSLFTAKPAASRHPPKGFKALLSLDGMRPCRLLFAWVDGWVKCGAPA